MQVLIERNSTVSTSKSQDFTTFEDYQDHVDISVYEGERAMVKDNNFLGKFTLKDIPKSLRGVPKIQVTFTIDTNGILQVSAEDAKSNKKSEIQIANEKGRLTQNDIQKMLQEAEKYKGEDEISKGDMLAKEELKVYFQRFDKGIQEPFAWHGSSVTQANHHVYQAGCSGALILTHGQWTDLSCQGLRPVVTCCDPMQPTHRWGTSQI